MDIIHASALKTKRVTLVSIPSPRDHDYFYEAVFRDWVCPAYQQVTQGRSDKSRVFFSRSRWKGGVKPTSRSLINRAEVEQCFEEAGFVIVHPQEHPIYRQVAIARGATVLAGEGGSALHHSVFMAPGNEVIVLQSGRQNHFIQASLCKLSDQSVSYVVGSPETEDWMSNFDVDPRWVWVALEDHYARTRVPRPIPRS